MKIEYDSQVDVAYLRLVDADVVDSEEIKPRIVVDYDKDNRIVGIEILHFKKHLPEADLSRIESLVA